MMYEWDWLILIGVIILGVFIYSGRKNKKLKKRKDALKILDERYAKGEITKEEYIERKETINPTNTNNRKPKDNNKLGM
ncbi:SHOCT domain-containing protein [Autumnicola edwardsiae]|uniref:SHOCT domain-containing protein n=1 Tax=Autumnicola edwardsiae TaxID=3075594 RepID=A0ABU3CXU6_9FLAO|nr:SHOCT domain-containing protein [Zunongwangia sp. F297]MDT0651086.1 SHOCT domain-containing protein [Zunongwangia sp. F297]